MVGPLSLLRSWRELTIVTELVVYVFSVTCELDGPASNWYVTKESGRCGSPCEGGCKTPDGCPPDPVGAEVEVTSYIVLKLVRHDCVVRGGFWLFVYVARLSSEAVEAVVELLVLVRSEEMRMASCSKMWCMLSTSCVLREHVLCTCVRSSDSGGSRTGAVCCANRLRFGAV